MNLNRFKKSSKFSDEQFQKLREALTYLSDKQRSVIHMRFWEKMSILEISNCIGLSWKSTDEFIDSAINHLRIRILQSETATQDNKNVAQAPTLSKAA